MNRVYKVIYNRARNLYQVVSEIVHSRGKTKSLTAQHQHERLTTAILIALFAMGTSLPVVWADEPTTADTTVSTSVRKDNANAVSGGEVYNEVRPTDDTNTKYVKSTKTTAENLTALDTQVKQNTDAIAQKADTTALDAKADKTDLAAKANISLDNISLDNLSDNGKQVIQALLNIQDSDNVTVSSSTDDTTKIKTFTITVNTNGAVVSGNAGLVTGDTVYREVRPSTDGNYVKKTQTTADNLKALDTQVSQNTTSISTNTAAIGKLKDLSNITPTGKTAIKNLLEVVGDNDQVTVTYSDDSSTGKRTYTVTVKKDGAIAADNNNLVTGKTVYEYLNASNLNKYFKVNPEITTNADNTKTYAAEAVANGTNSVAIGPNAKTATYTTTVTSSGNTTTKETTADHAVAIGDGATVNAAGDQGIALGKGAVTGEAEASTSDGTTTTTTDAKGGESSVAIGDSARANGNQALAFGKDASVLNPTGTGVSTGSTAIGSGAKVDGGSNSIALGTSAVVNTVSDAMALGNGATINKTATGSIAIGKAAVTGGVDKPITLTNDTTGTLAAAGGLDSIAIGNGAVSEGNEALALGKGAKVTNGAIGGDSAAAIVKTGSAAIGDGAAVTNSATSMAIGNGASITEGENTTVIGSGANAAQTKQAFVAGYQASADSNASGSIALGDNASTHSEHTTAIGYKAEAHNADSIAIGSEAKTDDNGGGIAIGNKTSVAQGGIAIGNATQASNISSLAIGNGAVANVNQSISIGYNAGVNTSEDYKERNGSLVAIGTSAGNNVKGMQNVAIGASAGSSVLSSNNIAIGTNAGYGIKNVTSETDTNPQNGYNISIGAGANYTEGNTNQNIVSSIAIGHATHAVNRAVAIGEGASAQGDSGMALGNSAKSSGSGSIAIGNAASAADGNIAFGAGAIASGSPSGNAKWTGQDAPKYYISVGNPGGGSTDSPMLRRISNVADGSDDHDVATVAQLQEVSNQLKNTIVGTDSDNKDVQTYSTTYIDNKVTELKNNISASKTKYFSVNPSSQTTNSGGTGANTDGAADAMAIGPNAKASSVKALAIGNNVSASGTLSIAIGTASNPSTDTTTAETPHPTSSEGTSSVAIGTSAIAQTNDSIAIGTRAATYTANTTSTPVSTVGVQSVAIGFSAETRDDNAISIGTKSKANSADAVAIGDGAEALNTNAVVIGKASTAEGSDSVTIGMSNANNGKAVITTGNSNQITNSQGVKDTVQNSGLYGSSNAISSVSSSNTSNAITDVYAVGNGNKLNQMGEKNVLTDVSIMGNQNAIENGTAGAYTQTVKQIAVVGSGNAVKGNTQVDATTWGTVQRDTILGYDNTVDATTQWTPVSNLQILGNDVTATLGNSVYLGTGSSATASKSATTEAITLAKEQGDAEAIASDEYKKATTEAEQTAIKQKYEAQYIHAANIAAMDQEGISAGITNYDKDYTYGNDSAYTYAGSQATGVVTVGSKDATRRIQNVSAGLVGPNSTDAVNGSQLYALTRQIRFGGDNSTFGKTAAADDVNVVAKGSNEKLAITGGAEGVSNTTTTDGKSVTTVDGTKIADKNIAVIAEDDALHVKLASNLKDLNTAQLGKTTATTTKADDGTETTTYSYQETLKLDGTGDNGGTLALKDAKGENGVTLRTSGATKTADVTGAETNRLLVNDKTVATTDDGLKFGGDTGTDSALKLNSKLTVKGGATTGLSDNNNIGVVSDGNGTLTVKLNKNVNLGTDGSLTTGTVTATTVATGSSTLNTNGLTITGGPKFTSNGISANSQQIKNVLAGTDDTDAANYSQIKKATTTLTTGKNGNVNVTTNTTPTADGHTNYTIAVDNLAVKANGTGNTSVELARGINFQNGDNTTATVDADGTVTINATHNKLRTVSAATGDKDNVILTLTDVDGNTVTSTGLKNTYTTVTKDGTAHTVTFARNDGKTENLSLGDLDGASKSELATAAAKATSEVTNGTNVTSVTKTTGNNNQNIYTVNVDDLAVKTTDGEKKSVHLKDGLVFADGTNTTATVGDNGTIKFNVSDNAIKKQAVDAINVTGGSNVTVTPETNADGTLKTFTVAASDLKYSANGTSKTTSLANGISFAAGSNTTVEIDNNGAIKINATHNKLNATGTATKATADSNAVTLTLNDQDGNTTTTALTDTYTTVSKDATNKKVTFKRNDGETQTLELSDLGGITEAQDKYVTGGKVTYEANGNGTAALTGNNGLTASITGLKDTKVSSGAATYVDAHGKATMTGSATLTMNDGTKATISGLKDDYITSASVGTETNHVTMTRLGGGTVDLNLNPILEKYSLSDYHLVGDGTTHDRSYAVDSNGTVTLNVVDDKNPNGTPKTIQITGLASQSGVNAGRTTVKSSDSSVTVSDSTANSDIHTYDIKVDYSKIPANLTVRYSGDNGISGSNTMDKTTAFSGTANQIVTTAADGKVSFKLADDISGIQSVTTGDAKLNTNGLTVTNGPTFTKSNIDANKQQIHKVLAGTENTDAANVSQVKAATTEVKAGTNTTIDAPTKDSTDNHQVYTVNVDNLALSQNDAKVGTGVALKNGLNFKDGTNTTASVTADGKVSFSISNDAIKAQAKNAVVLTAGDNVTIGTPTDVDNVKTYTVSVNDLKLQADGANKATRKLADGINFTGGTNTTADVTTDGKVTYNLKDSISLNQVQTDDSTLNTNGLTITGGPKVLKSGIDAGNKQITNVASGGDVESNAATIGDLKKAIETASAGTTASGFKTKGNYGEAVTSPLDKQLNVVGDVDTTKVAQENLSNGNVGVVTSKDTAGNATLTVKLNKDINLGESGSVTTGSTVMNNAGITNGNMSLGANGLTIQNGPKFTNNGIDAANQKVTGVANGINSNDAVNVSQLEEVKSDVTTGWTIAGKNTSGTDLTANIGKGKTVSYAGGKYATATLSVDSTTGNATLAVDAVTNTLSVGADGKLTSNGDGLTTTGAVKDAINGAYWTIQAGNATGNAQKVSAGSTITFNAGSNLSLSQDGTNFTYALNTDLQNMTSITAKDKKDNTAVLTGEGLKVSDKDGNSLTQHATEIRIHDSNAKADDTITDVVLKKDGLHNGGHTITGVADGQLSADSKEAVNGSQLYALQQKVTNGGWDIIGDNENKSTHIGNDKTVSFKSGKNSTVSVTGTDTGAEVKVDVNTAQISTNDAHQATATGTGLADASEVVNAINSAAWNVQKKDGAVQQVKAGDTVTFDAGNNIVLAQNDKSFTYGLASDVNTNSIRLGGSQDTNGDWTGGIFIGKQIGGGANQNEGNYITGLANTSWDLAKVVDNRAATEAQLREAINQITLKEQNGGFALKDESGNEKGRVSQTLGNAIAIVGDTEYESDGKTVKKAGNITTEADGTNVGGIKVKLNKNLDLSDEGSLRVGSSKVSNGAIQLGEDASANKILMDSTNGTASIGGVTVNGAKKTVNGLSNTKWTGTAVDGQAATENQLVEAINEAKTQAANSELHIKKGVYAIGKDSKGQEITDKVGKNSVSIDVVNATGTVDGQVVINDVAKASELGAVGELAANLKNPAGGPTTVVQAVNKVNQKVDDSLKQVNGDITSAVTEAKKHTKVAHVDGDSNVIIDGTQKMDDNGTVYKLGLNKDHVDLNQVHIYGNEGWVKTKKVEAETVKIDDKTNLDKTGLTTGNTTVADGRVVVGGDNGIKIEAKGDQQTISCLSNRIWTGKAVSGRAATEDQLQQAVENATATAAQNEQHIQSGNYDVGQGKGLDGKPIGKNSVAINVVSGDGTKPGDVKGQVVINNVAKADELGDVAKLNGTVRNGNGHPTSTVDAINNLDNRVETKVGDNTYSRVKGKEIDDGDSATTAIGKLNNRMNDIYTTAGQHSTVSTVDANLTLSEGKNASGGTDYKLGLNKEHIDLGNVTINGNAGSIKADSFTAGDTVVNKDGVKVGDKSALTGDSLKVGGKTYVDDKGIDANGQAIRNVGDGKNDGDAVNVKQVNDLAARQGEAIGQNAAHINQLDRAVNRLDSRINRVGAGAAALAALHPGNYDPDDKVDFAAGFGNYRGASAAAVGMYYHPDETTTMSVGASFGGGENMVNAGITWKMGKDSGHMRTQAAQKAVPVQFVAAPTQTQQSSGQAEGTKMPQPVTAVTTTASGQQVPIVAAYLPSIDNSTRAENDELKELLARQTAILEKLAEQKTAAAPAAAAAPVSGEDLFPDVPENHWAYDFVAKLAQAGALKDCRVEDPANNPMLTRNDFAQILYTALKNGATKNPALNKDNGLNRLASEFRAELKNVKR